MPHLQALAFARRASILATAALLAACGTYEPPKGGSHRGPGEGPSPDAICAYETATASKFVRLRCERPEDIKARGENDRSTIDDIRTPPPDLR